MKLKHLHFFPTVDYFYNARKLSWPYTWWAYNDQLMLEVSTIRCHRSYTNFWHHCWKNERRWIIRKYWKLYIHPYIGVVCIASKIRRLPANVHKLKLRETSMGNCTVVDLFVIITMYTWMVLQSSIASYLDSSFCQNLLKLPHFPLNSTSRFDPLFPFILLCSVYKLLTFSSFLSYIPIHFFLYSNLLTILFELGSSF